MTIIKPWMQVALALALGFSLGLLTHGARAANVAADAFTICQTSGTPGAICVMKYAETEAQALKHAASVLEGCATMEEHIRLGIIPFRSSDCPSSRAYIRARWGY